MFRIRRLYIKDFVFIVFILFFYSCSHIQLNAHAESKYFESLEKKLILDGFDKNRIYKIYADKMIKFDAKGVSAYFRHREGKLNYDQFLEEWAISRAVNYMETYSNELKNAEIGFGVDRRIITAILLVETGLGTYFGNRLVINTLSTMAALEDPAIKESLWEQISDSTNFTKEEFQGKAEKKSGWAYNELKAFLQYTDKEKSDIFEIYGSYAGAMGICQFMPSNILTLAKDGDKDGHIDLFNHADAIMSVASYLANYGWYPQLTEKEAYKAIYGYNHSDPYVNTILKIAETLKGK